VVKNGMIAGFRGGRTVGHADIIDQTVVGFKKTRIDITPVSDAGVGAQHERSCLGMAGDPRP